VNTLSLFAHESNPPKLKQCPKCPEGQQWHPATPEHFSRNKNREDGLQTICKTCTKEYKKRHYQAHKEEIDAKNKAYAESHKEQMREKKKQYAESHREHLQEYHARYYEENKEQLLEEMKQYYQNNREQKIAYQRQYEETHREQVRENKRQYRERNKGRIYEHRKTRYKERIRDYHKMYYKMHRGQHLENMRKYRETHRERLLAHKRNYYKTPQGRMIDRAHWHRRRAQKLASGGSYTAQQIRDQLKRQKRKCYWCSCKLGAYHIDHIAPLSRGGSNDISNIVLACAGCNLRKGAKLPHEWSGGGRLL